MKTSAGILLYRDGPEFFLTHPGGPYWARKDLGVWTIPKGEVAEGEDLLAAALREFEEETGCAVDAESLPLTPIKQPSGKLIHVWAVMGNCDPATLRSNLFSMEWPPKSGSMQQFPEVDRAAWFPLAEAHRRIIPGQLGFIDEVLSLLGTAERWDPHWRP